MGRLLLLVLVLLTCWLSVEAEDQAEAIRLVVMAAVVVLADIFTLLIAICLPEV